MSQLIKLAPNALDLGSAKAAEVLAAWSRGEVQIEDEPKQFEGRPRTAEELVKRASYTSWMQPGVHGELKDARRPPLLPDDFASQMEAKTLTNGKDKAVCVGLQRKVATAVLGGARSLDFSNLGWGADDARLLAKALPWCRELQALNVSGNELGDAGAAALCEALRDHASLRELQCAALSCCVRSRGLSRASARFARRAHPELCS